MTASQKVKAVLKDALLSCSEEEIIEFFEKEFLAPLNATLDGDEKVPAETIRYQRQQTNKIRNILLTYRKK